MLMLLVIPLQLPIVLVYRDVSMSTITKIKAKNNMKAYNPVSKKSWDAAWNIHYNRMQWGANHINPYLIEIVSTYQHIRQHIRNCIVLWQIYSKYEFAASNIFQKSYDGATEHWRSCIMATQSTWLSISQEIRLIGNRWSRGAVHHSVKDHVGK